MKLKELKQIIKEEVNIFLKENKLGKKPIVKEDKVLKIGNATVVIPDKGAPQIHLPQNARGKTLQNLLIKIKDELKNV